MGASNTIPMPSYEVLPIQRVNPSQGPRIQILDTANTSSASILGLRHMQCQDIFTKDEKLFVENSLESPNLLRVTRLQTENASASNVLFPASFLFFISVLAN